MSYISELRKKVGHAPLMAPAAMAIIYDEEKKAILTSIILNFTP